MSSRRSNEEWRTVLSPEAYRVTREAGTEAPFSGDYVGHDAPGVYHCVCCGNELFRSEEKFDAHCGWPSFSAAIASGRVLERPDTSHGMMRTEVVCTGCDAHLGHVFDDGPGPAGLRYCINSVALTFKPE